MILSDQATLGFVRLLVAAATVYGLASIAVLISRGRRLRSISTTGIEADASQYSDRAINTPKEDLRRARLELDEAKRLMSRFPEVKSNVRTMPKRRKIEVDAELLKELHDLRRRMEETDRRIEETLKMAEEAQRRLRLVYGRR